MIQKDFFTRMLAQLRTISAFGVNVWVATHIPVIASIPQQVSPSAFLLDGGYENHGEHPNIIIQNFSIAYFLENVQSEYGSSAVVGSNGALGICEIDALIARNVIETVSLTEKIIIVEKGVMQGSEVSGNHPLVQRQHNYYAILQAF